MVFPAKFNLTSLDGSEGFSITGTPAGSWGGHISGFLGDVNGDGIGDLLYGAAKENNGTGKVYIIYGMSSSLPGLLDVNDINGANGFSVSGVAPNGQFGSGAGGAGDVNGDGLGDIIVGAINANNGFGQSYVIYGSSSGFANPINVSSLNGKNGFVIDGTRIWDGFISHGAGDINGDGVDDLLIGSPGDPSNKTLVGQAHVIYGDKGGSVFTSYGYSTPLSLNSLNGKNGFVINGVSVEDRAGYAVSGIGDVNADGITDFMIGAPGANGYTGSAYIVFGNKTGFSSPFSLSSISGNNGFIVNGVEAYEQVGGWNSKVGDINGDSIDDILVGESSYYGNNPGKSIVIFGSKDKFPSNVNETWTDGANGFVIQGPIGSNSGWVGMIGDVNGDGFADIQTSNFYAGDLTGAAYITYGSDKKFTNPFKTSNLNGKNGFAIPLQSVEVNYSPIAGDINGDGVSDILLTSTSANDNCGAGYIIYGQGGFPFVGTNGFIMPMPKNYYISSSKAGGYFEGQENGNIAFFSQIGHASFWPIHEEMTQLYIYGMLPSSHYNEIQSFNINKKSANTTMYFHQNQDYKGISYDTGWDFNGDGLTDVVASVYGSEGNTIYVTYGNSTYTHEHINEWAFVSPEQGFEINPNNSCISDDVSFANVNGDKYADVVIKCTQYPSSYIVYGTSQLFPNNFPLKNLDGTNGFVMSANEGCQIGATTIGDINGDGYTDFMTNCKQNQTIAFGHAGANYPLQYNYYSNPFDGNTGFVINLYSDSSISSAGDINNDGYEDIFINNLGYPALIDGDPPQHVSVQQTLIYGAHAFPALINSTTVTEVHNTLFLLTDNYKTNDFDDDPIGYKETMLKSLGDVNNDGFDDIGVVLRKYNNNLVPENLGQALVIYGTNSLPETFNCSTLSPADGRVINGNNAERILDIGPLGDVNEDGIGDIALNGMCVSGTAETDCTFIIFGEA